MKNTKLSYQRIFTSNDSFTDDNALFSQELALAVSWLYSDEADDKDDQYQLTDILPLYELMNVALLFHQTACKPLGVVTLKEYISDMMYDDDPYNFLRDFNSYSLVKGNLVFSRMQSRVILPMLWVAYVYTRLLTDLIDDDPKQKAMFQEAVRRLYDELVRVSGMKPEVFGHSFLMRHLEPTMQRFMDELDKRQPASSEGEAAETQMTDDRDAEVVRMTKELRQARQALESLTGDPNYQVGKHLTILHLAAFVYMLSSYKEKVSVLDNKLGWARLWSKLTTRGLQGLREGFGAVLKDMGTDKLTPVINSLADEVAPLDADFAQFIRNQVK